MFSNKGQWLELRDSKFITLFYHELFIISHALLLCKFITYEMYLCSKFTCVMCSKEVHISSVNAHTDSWIGGTKPTLLHIFDIMLHKRCGSVDNLRHGLCCWCIRAACCAAVGWRGWSDGFISLFLSVSLSLRCKKKKKVFHAKTEVKLREEKTHIHTHTRRELHTNTQLLCSCRLTQRTEGRGRRWEEGWERERDRGQNGGGDGKERERERWSVALNPH